MIYLDTCFRRFIYFDVRITLFLTSYRKDYGLYGKYIVILLLLYGFYHKNPCTKNIQFDLGHFRAYSDQLRHNIIERTGLVIVNNFVCLIKINITSIAHSLNNIISIATH